MSQLTNDMDAADLTLSEEVLAGLEDLHKVYTYPCP